ncbi:MAG: carboxymuconolactone decarboxylase family protein [Candidatus Atribacteria bacterium]|nr:carboxymuconolactone decarboxylase family protein [Candidatus Atribacteria bacterium]
MTDPREFWENYRQEIKELKNISPATVENYSSFYAKVMQDGVLSLKTKELIALAVGLTIHCEHCVILHVRGALKSGATPEEIWEAAQVGVAMGGGPAFTFLPLVKKAIEEFKS